MGRRKAIELPKGVSLQGGLMRLSFSYQGRNYRKRTGLAPTPDNVALITAQLAQMRAQRTLGTLDIEAYFPSKATTEKQQMLITPLGKLVRDECERKLNIGAWTLSTYERRIGTLTRHFNPVFGMLTVAELKPEHVRSWLKQQTYSSAYASQVLGLMRFIFDTAVGDGLIERHPFAHINPSDYLKNKSPNQRKQLINPLTFEEIERVLNAAPDRERALWGVGFFTGMRIQELLTLRWEDIDWESETIHIRRAAKRRVSGEEYVAETKTESSDRIIEVDQEVMRHLRNHRKYTQLEGTYIFKPERTVYSLSSAARKLDGARTRQFLKHERDRYGFNTLEGLWKAALKRAGVSLVNRTPKQIRHTYASLMLSEGMSPMNVANTMGHISLTMLEKHYAKAIMQGKKKRRNLDLTAMRRANNAPG